MSGKFTKEELKLLKKIEMDAYNLQRKYRGCTQTCLLALQENFGFGNVDTFKAGNALCSGVAGMGVGPCGALTGGVMALGILFGRAVVEEAGGPREGGKSNFTRTFTLAKELYEKFSKHYKGGVSCQHVQTVFYEKKKLHPELGDKPYYESQAPEIQPLKETGEYYEIVSQKACFVVQTAARMTAEIILRERKIEYKMGKHIF